MSMKRAIDCKPKKTFKNMIFSSLIIYVITIKFSLRIKKGFFSPGSQFIIRLSFKDTKNDALDILKKPWGKK